MNTNYPKPGPELIPEHFNVHGFASTISAPAQTALMFVLLNEKNKRAFFDYVRAVNPEFNLVSDAKIRADLERAARALSVVDQIVGQINAGRIGGIVFNMPT